MAGADAAEEHLRAGRIGRRLCRRQRRGTATVGAGANLLVGGSSQAFTLQPLSLQTQTGINFAIGVSQFQLRSTEN